MRSGDIKIIRDMGIHMKHEEAVGEFPFEGFFLWKLGEKPNFHS
jgi:hypothetical protein